MTPLLQRTAAPIYPALLEDAIAHARRFVRTLRALEHETTTDDSALLWLEGRSDEVRAFVLDVLRSWNRGEVTAAGAALAIDGYLKSLHAALEGWFGRWYAPSCCGPLSGVRESGIRPRTEEAPRRLHDSLADTLDEAPAVTTEVGAQTLPEIEAELPASVRRISARAVGIREVSSGTVTMGGIGVMRLRLLG